MAKDNQLSKEQIEELFQFVESKYVRYKDVQFEIVDHLASGIEEIQKIDHTISFKSALRQVYNRFPITGFAKFVEERSKSLTNFWTTKFLSYIIGYFKLPKILITILLTLIFYMLIPYLNPDNVENVLFFMATVTPLLMVFTLAFDILDKRKRRKYLVIKSYQNVIFSIIYIVTFSPYYIYFFAYDIVAYMIDWGQINTIILSLIMSVYFVTTHACLVVFPKLLEKEISSKYNHLIFD